MQALLPACRKMRFLCVVALASALTPPPTPRMLKPGPDARLETLSETPRIYRVANALDRATCEALMASEAASQMTTSNAPAAQLDPEKLTLLAPLILLAPLPRVVGALMNGEDLFAAALPPLIGATAVAAALALALVCVFPGSLDAWIGFVQMVLLAVGAGLLLRSMYPGAREEAPLLG